LGRGGGNGSEAPDALKPSTVATRDPELLKNAEAAGPLWRIDTGHDLMITEPELVSAALVEVAPL
jgi:hypothetical protein